MLRFEERDDVTVQNPPSGEVVLFYTDGAFRIKDSAGEVTTITTVEGLEEVAEATEPKVYVALLTQTGTDAPVATILKNTLGGIPIWTYSGVGDYVCTLTGVFTTDKTAISCQSTGGAQYGVPLISSLALNNFTLSTFDLYAADLGDGVLTKALIKIEVYP